MFRIFKSFYLILVCSFLLVNPKTITAQSSDLEPVVLIPGIMGSWSMDVLFKNKSVVDGWKFPPTDQTWDNMIDALEKAGYEKDKTLFIAFYDWRQHNTNSVVDYLMPTIDKAVVNSPTGKVDIVAHSMGGLIARSYIQGSRYRDDVDQLVMLGTPNYGSGDVYTLWEGGIVPNNWPGKEKIGIGSYLWYMTTATQQTADNYDTIHTFIPSIKELLPTYNYLEDSEGNIKNTEDLVDARNSFLNNLNIPSFTGKKIFDRIKGITIVAGKGEATVGNVPVVERGAPETKLWADGLPNPLPPERNVAEGDNRVLLSSAFIDEFDLIPPAPVQNFLQKFFAKLLPTVYAQTELGDFLVKLQVDSKHGDLPTTAIDKVFGALSLSEPTIAYVPPAEPDNITSFWFASPVEVEVTDPLGRIITKDLNSIPDAEYTGESDPNGVKMIIIPNGLDGEYKIKLKGTGDGSYHMAATRFTDLEDKIVTVEKEVKIGEIIEYKVNIGIDTSSEIIISEPTITEPDSENPPIEKSAIELIKELMSDLNKNFENGKIKNKGIYQSLMNDLKIAEKALEESLITRPIGEKLPKLHELKVKIAEKLAVKKLNDFISKIEDQSSKNKMEIEAATAMTEKARDVIEYIL